MTILIKDSETDKLVRELADRTGQSLTNAVKIAVVEQLKRLPLSKEEIASRKEKVARILAKLDAMPTVDHRTADEIIGYNEQGLFD